MQVRATELRYWEGSHGNEPKLTPYPSLKPILVFADGRLGKWRVSEKSLVASWLDPKTVVRMVKGVGGLEAGDGGD